MGDSAGAFLAATLFLRGPTAFAAARPADRPRLLGLCLVCPWLDLAPDFSCGSHARNARRDGLQPRAPELQPACTQSAAVAPRALPAILCIQPAACVQPACSPTHPARSSTHQCMHQCTHPGAAGRSPPQLARARSRALPQRCAGRGGRKGCGGHGRAPVPPESRRSARRLTRARAAARARVAAGPLLPDRARRAGHFVRPTYAPQGLQGEWAARQDRKGGGSG